MLATEHQQYSYLNQIGHKKLSYKLGLFGPLGNPDDENRRQISSV